MKIELSPTQKKQQRAAIYARVSSSKQRDEGTIESQVDTLLNYAKNKDLQVPEGWIFKDDGISGSTIQRPSLDSLRDLIEAGSPDVVLIYQPDRLARKYVYQVLLLEEFSKRGVEVIFYKNKKAETPEDHLLEQFQGIFAEYERAQIAERCRRGRLYKAKQGSVSVLPNAPYGYRYIKDQVSGLARYELHQEESETVLKLFQMYGCEGKSLTDLCSYMNQRGLKPRRSELGWERETIRRMLRNRSYTGQAGFCKTEKSEGDSQRIVRAPKNGRTQVSKFARSDRLEEDWITIPVPAIVSADLYCIVQDKLKKAQQFASRNTRKPSMLQGVLVCGKCQASYYKKARTNAYTYYCCYHSLRKKEKSCDNRSIRQQWLDDYVWNWITSILRDPELVATEIRRRLAEDPERKCATERKMSLIRDLNKLQSSRNKLIDAYSEGDCLSIDELKKRMNILNQHKQQVERELAVLEAQTADENRINQTQLTLEKFANAIEDSSMELSVEEKQRVVRSLIDEIVIHEDFINIRHCIPIGKDRKQDSENCPLHQKRRAAAVGKLQSEFNRGQRFFFLS